MLFYIKSNDVNLEQPKRQIFALNVMTIRDRRHANKSKQTMSVAGFDVGPPIGVVSRSRDLMFSLGNEEHQERYFEFHLGRLQLKCKYL